MHDTTLFMRLLQTHYDAAILDLQPFAGSFVGNERMVLQARLADGTSWIVRAYHRSHTLPDWLAGCGTRSPCAWLHSRAATLAYLAERNYPAPRVVTTRSGTMIGTTDDWYILPTTFIKGDVVDPTPSSLHQLGAALGRLHRLSLADEGTMPATPGKSWWYPELAVPAALAQYAVIASELPLAWKPTMDAFCATLRTIQHSDALPRALIHGDAWAGNAVQTATGTSVLIDWEPSGQGHPILDLGRLLLYGHFDLATSWPMPLRPTAWRIHAIIDGYCTQRIPTPSERTALLDAIRFGVAFGAATHFLQAHHTGWQDPMPERLTRRQHWFAVSETIAEVARQRLEHRG